RTDRARAGRAYALEHAVRMDHGTSRQRAVPQHTARPQAGPVAQLVPAFEHDVDVDAYIPADRDFAAHVDPRRVRDADALCHQRLRLTLPVPTFERCQLALVVGTHQVVR